MERYRQSSAIILGTKRSGSNFTHDVLSYAYESAVQEPLGLHNEGPMSFTLNPLTPWRYSSVQHVSLEYGHTELEFDPYGSLLTRNFISWLKEGSRLIKETDFLYLGWLYGSVKPLRTLILERDPRDSIASFKRGNLYDRWGYAEKMGQFITTIRTTELGSLYNRVSALDDFTNQPRHRQLALYYAIATKEIGRHTNNREKMIITYEAVTGEPLETFQDACNFLGIAWDSTIRRAATERTTSTRSNGIHGTFRHNSDINSYTNTLTYKEEADIRSIFDELGICLNKPSPTTTLSSEEWNYIYPRDKLQYVVKQRDRVDVATEIQKETVSIDIGKTQPLMIGKYLVTNEQYAQFLIWLQQNSIPITSNGKPIFYNDRPETKIHLKDNVVVIDENYMNHPVTFVSWIAASAFCAWINGRLPTPFEWDRVSATSQDKTLDFNTSNNNVEQRYGDTLPVNSLPPDSRGIYDLVGNAGLWVDSLSITTLEAERRGIGWNHSLSYGLHEHPRPYWLGSTGVGIRPVFDRSTTTYSDDIIYKLRDIVSLLTESPHEHIQDSNNRIFQKVKTLRV